MTRTTLEGWLKDRRPEVPPSFLPHLLSGGDGASPVAEDLARLAANAIAGALARPGRNRDAAFSLLVGDAFLTYACEAVVEDSGDVGEGLEALILHLGARFP